MSATKTKVIEVQVSREAVVEAADAAIKKTRVIYDVPAPLARKLRNIARRKKEFALETWYVDGRCGCLIGWLRGADDAVPVSLSDVSELRDFNLGINFDEELKERLSPRERRRVAAVKTSDIVAVVS